MYVREDPIALVCTNEPASDRIPDQLLGVLDRELSYARGRPDSFDQGIRDRTAEDAGDPGQGFEQRRDLRPAEFGSHERRCSDVEGGAKLQSGPGSVNHCCRRTKIDAPYPVRFANPLPASYTQPLSNRPPTCADKRSDTPSEIVAPPEYSLPPR